MTPAEKGIQAVKADDAAMRLGCHEATRRFRSYAIALKRIEQACDVLDRLGERIDDEDTIGYQMDLGDVREEILERMRPLTGPMELNSDEAMRDEIGRIHRRVR